MRLPCLQVLVLYVVYRNKPGAAVGTWNYVNVIKALFGEIDKNTKQPRQFTSETEIVKKKHVPSPETSTSKNFLVILTGLTINARALTVAIVEKSFVDIMGLPTFLTIKKKFLNDTSNFVIDEFANRTRNTKY